MGLLLLPSACSSSEQALADAWREDKSTTAKDAGIHDLNLGHLARVYEVDPETTPTLKDVVLRNVAEDVGGVLTSAADKNGVRKIRVVSCVDEGRVDQGRRVCTLKARANAMDNGNFVFADLAQGGTAVDDRAAEVMAYYHVQRAYDFVTSKAVGLFDVLPARHTQDGKAVPLTVVVNFRAPSASGPLKRTGRAMYFPQEFGRMGMFAMEGLKGIEGDVLVFGQGNHTDFAYSGETAYHEFGHMAFTALTGTYFYTYADNFGMCHLNNVISEGIADTFAWLISGHRTLGEYCDIESGKAGAYIRHADNKARFPKDLVGLFLRDGQVLSGAHYEAFQLLREKAKLDQHAFARLLMKTLMSLAKYKGKISFAIYADEFLSTATSLGQGDHVKALRALFEARGLYRPRAKDITSFDGKAGVDHLLLIDGTDPMKGGAFMKTTRDGVPASMATTFVQSFVDLPKGNSIIELAATLDRHLTFPSDPSTLDVELLLRKDGPILYDVQQTPVTIDFDLAQKPTLATVPSPRGSIRRATWTLKGLQGGARYYRHIVNYGASGGSLRNLEVSIR
ncbi:MAG: hypothetical protein CSA65_07000 [Proteobacteria bacterium]|nr:MAG: hypothetical protein CSA65_07000 [Pseudomonadota bacterium]